MALKRMSTKEMVSLSQALGTPATPERIAFAATPMLSGLLPELDGSYQGLLATQVLGRRARRLIALQTDQAGVDVDHDDIVRAIYYRLMAEINGALTEAERIQARMLLDLLLPDGLSLVKTSYREESGAAHLAAARITAEHQAMLRAIPMSGASLWQLVERWQLLARRLGELEDMRVEVATAEGSSPADVLTARNRWIRTIHAIRSIAALLPSLPPEIEHVLARIAAVEQRADRRMSKSPDADADSDVIDETADTDPLTGAEPPDDNPGTEPADAA